MWNIIRALHSQLSHRFKPHVFALGGDVLPRATFVVRTVDDFVVDIGDVRRKAHFKTRIREVPTQNVIDQGGAAMAEVRGPVHRGATEIDADFARIAKRQGFHPLGGGVIEVQHSDKPTI